MCAHSPLLHTSPFSALFEFSQISHSRRSIKSPRVSHCLPTYKKKLAVVSRDGDRRRQNRNRLMQGRREARRGFSCSLSNGRPNVYMDFIGYLIFPRNRCPVSFLDICFLQPFTCDRNVLGPSISTSRRHSLKFHITSVNQRRL